MDGSGYCKIQKQCKSNTSELEESVPQPNLNQFMSFIVIDKSEKLIIDSYNCRYFQRTRNCEKIPRVKLKPLVFLSIE